MPIALGMSHQAIAAALAGLAIVPTLSKVDWRGLFTDEGEVVKDVDKWTSDTITSFNSNDPKVNTGLMKSKEFIEKGGFLFNTKEKIKSFIKWSWDKIKSHPMFFLVSSALVTLKGILSKLGDKGIILFGVILIVTLVGLYAYNLTQFLTDRAKVNKINRLHNINDVLERKFRVTNQHHDIILDHYHDDMLLFKLSVHRDFSGNLRFSIDAFNEDLSGHDRVKLLNMLDERLTLADITGDLNSLAMIFRDEYSNSKYTKFLPIMKESEDNNLVDLIEDIAFLNYLIPKVYVSVRDMKTLSKIYR